MSFLTMKVYDGLYIIIPTLGQAQPLYTAYYPLLKLNYFFFFVPVVFHVSANGSEQNKIQEPFNK